MLVAGETLAACLAPNGLVTPLQRLSQKLAFQMPAVLGEPLQILTGSVGTRIWIDDRPFLNFSGTNYLDLANHPAAKIAAAAAISKHGISVAASRITTGTHRWHLNLERGLADFMGTEDAVLAGNGGHANQILLEALTRPEDVFFCEPSAHTSLKTGIPRANRLFEFDGSDLKTLRRGLRGVASGIILMNGVNAITGEVAPLPQILECIPAGKNIRVIVDDAHGIFVLGSHGRGTLEYWEIESGSCFQTATLSKALGGFGGFIPGSKNFCDSLRRTAAYGGATALPPGIAAAASANLNLMERRGRKWRLHLLDLAAHTARQLNLLGYETKFHGTPILLLKPSPGISPESVCTRLRNAGIYLPLIYYPNGSAFGKLRLTLSAGHTRQDIDRLCQALS